MEAEISAIGIVKTEFEVELLLSLLGAGGDCTHRCPESLFLHFSPNRWKRKSATVVVFGKPVVTWQLLLYSLKG